MKKQLVYLFALCSLVFVLSGCATNYKAQIETLGKCNYTIASVDQVRVAGRNIETLQSGDNVSLASLPAIAFALLQQDLPLEASVNLKISINFGLGNNIRVSLIFCYHRTHTL